MKTSTYLLCAGLMVVGLLVTVGPASAWPDTMPHHDFDSGSILDSSGQCSSHMPDPKNLGTPASSTLTFKLCKASSGASEWSTEIRSDVFPYQLVSPVCSFARVTIATNTFHCSVPNPGNYRSTIKYWVTNSPFAGHADRKFTR